MRVVAAVIRHGDKYFACRKAGNHENAGMWEFPGGKVQGSETDSEALLREIQEELGISIIVDEFIIKSSSLRGLGQIEMYSYFARLSGLPPVESSDHDLLGWFTIEQLQKLDWPPLDIPVVAALGRLD